MTGKTSWWPCDAAEHERELNVELGEEFEAAGPYVIRVLKDLAQAQRSDGLVRTGFRVLRQKAFTGTPERAREIVEHAASIGALDDLQIDEDGRRFTCRISGWQADQARGRETIKKANQRARDKEGHVPTAGDMSPSEVDVSGSVPPTRPEKTIEEKNSPAVPAVVVARTTPPAAEERHGSIHPMAEEITGILQRGIDSLQTDEPCKRPTVAAVSDALHRNPAHHDTVIAVAVETRATVQSHNRAPNIAGLFAQKLAAHSTGIVPGLFAQTSGGAS